MKLFIISITVLILSHAAYGLCKGKTSACYVVQFEISRCIEPAGRTNFIEVHGKVKTIKTDACETEKGDQAMEYLKVLADLKKRTSFFYHLNRKRIKAKKYCREKLVGKTLTRFLQIEIEPLCGDGDEDRGTRVNTERYILKGLPKFVKPGS